MTGRLTRLAPPLSSRSLCVVSLGLAALLWNTRPSEKFLAYAQERLRFSSTAMQESVQTFDALMDACKFRAYYNATSHERLAFSHYSPVGPLFVMGLQDHLSIDHPLLTETYVRIERDADIVLTPTASPTLPSDPNGTLSSILVRSFTLEAPACASDALPLGYAEVWFRKR